MKNKKYSSAAAVNLEELLEAREKRASKQKQLLFEYKKTLVVYTLNIAGPIKVFDLAVKTFYEGLFLIKKELMEKDIIIILEDIDENKTGYEAYLIVEDEASLVKKILLKIEDNYSLGRIFDIDVLDISGKKLSRLNYQEGYRKCLICDEPANLCRRNQTHSLSEIINKEIEIMSDYFYDKYSTQVANLAYNSLIAELHTTPKPGLVDLNNNGSHNDLNLNLFYKSATVLKPYFKKFVLFGIENKDVELGILFDGLRKLGIKAEKTMFNSTDKVNTHKGAIFIFSIVLATLGWLFANEEEYSRNKVVASIKKVTYKILNDFSNLNEREIKTNGENIYLKYNILGIRGESKEGFSIVFNLFLPIFIEQKRHHSFNDSGVFTLLKIIENIDDTNIIKRSDFETLIKIKDIISKELRNTNVDILELSNKMDEYFIQRNLSAGGSADLLALTYFLYFYENLFNINS